MLTNVATKSDGTTFGEIANFKINEWPKFGYLLDRYTKYEYHYNGKSNNDLDGFSYSFDVKDKDGTLNKIEFKVEIQLSKYAGFTLEKNEDRVNQNYIAPYSYKLGVNGEWENGENIGKFNGNTIKSKNKNSQIGFNFGGNSFDVYGFSSANHGEYDVYIDGKLINNNNIIWYSNSKNISSSLEIQKLSSHKLNKNKIYNVILKPRTEKPIELSHF